MAFRTNTHIVIEQQQNSAFPGKRDNVFTLDFVNEGEIVSTWQNMTDTAKIKLPRNVNVVGADGKPVNWTLQGIYGNNDAASPLFMRGDKITIDVGYWFDNFDGTETLRRTGSAGIPSLFTGYITKISNRVPIVLECEDEMWKLKSLAVKNKLYKGSEYTIQAMLTEMLTGTGITVVDGTAATIKTNIGDFRTMNETVAQVLDRLRKDGGVYSYFRNNELRCSGIVYYPQDRTDKNIFAFQENIISDSMEYTRKEDINICIIAHAEYITTSAAKNNDGTDKSKRKRLEVAVAVTNKQTGEISVIPNANNFDGDKITLPVTIKAGMSEADVQSYLESKAKEYLPKFYYTGWRGSFTTFGYPVVRHGDILSIQDNVIQERSGDYLVRQVSTKFGLSTGIRQTIMLHLRTDQAYTQSQLNAGI